MDEGTGDGAIDQRGVRSPTVRVGVVDHADAHLVRIRARVRVMVRVRVKVRVRVRVRVRIRVRAGSGLGLWLGLGLITPMRTILPSDLSFAMMS